MAERAYRANDVVKHGPSGETWTLACDEENGHVYWCGWPPDGRALAKDCELVEATADEGRVDMLRQVAQTRGDRGEVYRIASIATVTLHAEKLCGGTCAICTTERAAALSAAEAAVVKAAEGWHARRAMIGCTKEVEADLLAALRSACRELAERRGNG
jgi:hypothetical protein